MVAGESECTPPRARGPGRRNPGRKRGRTNSKRTVQSNPAKVRPGQVNSRPDVGRAIRHDKHTIWHPPRARAGANHAQRCFLPLPLDTARGFSPADPLWIHCSCRAQRQHLRPPSLAGSLRHLPPQPFSTVEFGSCERRADEERRQAQSRR